ncbi:AAA family ATPase [Teichococcus oryzae]|uniref:AAA family ATPase n=1 Tax=Teichococcus oryzae TaxID=1608942 RepID=A0A5B2TK33_9PROT|nr:AAA family ATPase [Pseudoroseomonas oryzae]KAA2214278.1 AAA family ATPase [Pseudoroseomonas oryzae]
MRLTRLGLRHYGPFTDVTLDLDARPGRVNLVLAPNGTGKSVLRGALGDLLFGIGGQTPMGFRHGYASMQISAEGLSPDGSRFAFTRRKGRTGTLLGADDAPLDPTLLPGLLGGADRALLERLFALDTSLLRQGGAGLLASGGDLAEALLQAAGGLRQAQTLGQELAGARDRLAPLRKSAQRPFYEALDQLKSSQTALRQSLLRPAQWRERERHLAEATERLEAARAAAAGAAAAQRRLERARRLAPALRRLDMAEAWLAAHPEAPLLPAGLGARLHAAREQSAQAARSAGEAERQHQHLRAEAAALAPGSAWLERAARIAALREAAGAAESNRARRPALLAEQGELDRRIEEALRGLGLGMSAARAAEALPAPALLEKAWRLLREYAPLADAEAGAPRELERHRLRLREAEAALAALPPPRDAMALEALAGAIRAEGDPAALLARDHRAVAEAEAAWATRAARLPPAWREATALRALPVPPADTLFRLGAGLAEAEAALRDAAAAEARAGSALAESQARRAALEAHGALPDAAALAAIRHRRQESWLRLRRPGAGEAEAMAFAALVAEADRVADQRFAEASRLRDAELLAAALRRQEAEHSLAAQQRDTARADAEAARRAWGAALRPLGLDPATAPDALRLALDARDMALDAAEVLDRQRAAAMEREERQQAWASRLAAALGENIAPLPVLLDRAEAALRASRAADTDRALHGGSLAESRRALAEAEQAAAAWRQKLLAWRSEWQAVLAALGRPADEAPQDSAAALELLGRLGPLVQQARTMEAQRRALDAEQAEFAAGCRALCAELGEPDPADPVAAARKLGERLQAEQALQSRREALLQEADKAARSAAALRREADAQAGLLRDAVAEAGAIDAETALHRLALSAERAARQEARDAALAEIGEGGDGLPLPALREEQAAHPPEAMEPALAKARQAGEAAQRAAEEAARDRARAEAEMQSLSRDGTAREAAADEQAALARLGHLLEEAVLLQASRSMLNNAMAKVQEAGDDALLRRIGAIFAGLTDGAYPSLLAREDEKGVAHLLVRRAEPEGEEAGVEALSEGTRDQLFLALRMVAIEDHAAAATPLPFLGDDILQSFDDRRAAAAFRALCRFSDTAQVILLTHHRHLAEVARAALPAGALHLRELA